MSADEMSHALITYLHVGMLVWYTATRSPARNRLIESLPLSLLDVSEHNHFVVVPFLRLLDT